MIAAILAAAAVTCAPVLFTAACWAWDARTAPRRARYLAAVKAGRPS